MSKKLKVGLLVVSLQEEGYHLFIENTIGEHPVRLLIDTGASKTVIDRSFLLDKYPNLKLEAHDQLTTGVGTNTIQSEFTEIPDLKLGPLHIPNYKVAVLDLKHVNETYHMINLPPIHGVLGCDLLIEYKAVINLKKKYLRLKPY